MTICIAFRDSNGNIHSATDHLSTNSSGYVYDRKAVKSFTKRIGTHILEIMTAGDLDAISFLKHGVPEFFADDKYDHLEQAIYNDILVPLKEYIEEEAYLEGIINLDGQKLYEFSSHGELTEREEFACVGSAKYGIEGAYAYWRAHGGVAEDKLVIVLMKLAEEMNVYVRV